MVVHDAFKNLSGWAAGLRWGLSLLLDFKRPGWGRPQGGQGVLPANAGSTFSIFRVIAASVGCERIG